MVHTLRYSCTVITTQTIITVFRFFYSAACTVPVNCTILSHTHVPEKLGSPIAQAYVTDKTETSASPKQRRATKTGERAIVFTVARSFRPSACQSAKLLSETSAPKLSLVYTMGQVRHINTRTGRFHCSATGNLKRYDHNGSVMCYVYIPPK